MLAKTLMTLK